VIKTQFDSIRNQIFFAKLITRWSVESILLPCHAEAVRSPLGEQTENLGIDVVDVCSDLIDVLAFAFVAHSDWYPKGRRMETEGSTEVVWSALSAKIDEPKKAN
jgi:hypothetical protein